MIERPERAMVVIPHPDDGEGGVGGTTAKWVEEGTEVVFVLCTNGDKGTSDPSMTQAKLAAVREREQAAAAKPRWASKRSSTCATATASWKTPKSSGASWSEPFASTSPTWCSAQTRFAPHSTSTEIIAYQGRSRWTPCSHTRATFCTTTSISKKGLETHKVGDVLMWGTEHPDTFIDITDTIETKIEALKKHDSQVGGGGRDVDRFVKENAQRQGQQADMTYAEGFRRIQFRR